MRAIKTYYAVLDQSNVLSGVGRSKPEARRNAFARHNRNQYSILPFKPSMECTEGIYKAFKEYGSCLAHFSINGVLHTGEEKKRLDEIKHNDLIRQACAGELSNEDFKAKLKLDEKLDIMYAMLKEVKEDHEKIINHLKWDS